MKLKKSSSIASFLKVVRDACCRLWLYLKDSKKARVGERRGEAPEGSSRHQQGRGGGGHGNPAVRPHGHTQDPSTHR